VIASTAATDAAPPTLAVRCNQVTLVGRLAASPVERTMPSGDLLVDFRVIVDRPELRRTGDRSRARIDTIDCVAWTSRLRRQVGAWDAGDIVEVTGSLRRRFWRSASGAAASRYEIEVDQARKVRRVTMAQ
jgi:single-strand DNA-binding protein